MKFLKLRRDCPCCLRRLERCPECGSGRTSHAFIIGKNIVCDDCGHEWTPGKRGLHAYAARALKT